MQETIWCGVQQQFPKNNLYLPSRDLMGVVGPSLGLLYLWLLQDLFFGFKCLFSVNPGSPRVVDRRPC